MPRYDDRYGSTHLYVGRLSSRTRSRDLDRLFSRYGRVRDADMKRDFAFVEFSDPQDADDARYSLDGRDFNGSCIIVEFAKGGPRGSRDYLGRGPPPGSGRCFNCGIDGHWARDCKAGDWKNKSSQSRSPTRIGRSLYHKDGSQSPPYRSPEPRDSPIPFKTRKRSFTPDEGSPLERGSPSPRNGRLATRQDGSDYSGSSRDRSRSPMSLERDGPVSRSYASPIEANGRNQSLSGSSRDDRSPIDVDDDDRRSPRGSESP